MFAVLHSDINSLKSPFVYLTGQPYSKKGSSTIVKDGIINLSLLSRVKQATLKHQITHGLLHSREELRKGVTIDISYNRLNCDA